MVADPKWRANYVAAGRKRAADPEWRAKVVAHCRKLHADPEYQVKLAAILCKRNTDPDFRATHAATMRKLQANSKYRAKAAGGMRAAGAVRRALLDYYGGNDAIVRTTVRADMAMLKPRGGWREFDLESFVQKVSPHSLETPNEASQQ